VCGDGSHGHVHVVCASAQGECLELLFEIECVLIGERRRADDIAAGNVTGDWQLATKNVTLVKDFDNRGVEYERILTADRTAPLLNAPRHIRATAMRLIPDLLDLIKSEAEELLQSIEQAELAAKKL
jgi:hypothetical protein